MLSSPKKKVAIIQSCYIPWKGYFDIINSVDTFILLDDVQYTRRDWRNRNQIKTPQGIKWLSIPIDNKGKYSNQRILEVGVSDIQWATDHWNQIKVNYQHAPHFGKIAAWLEPLYKEAADENSLSRINYLFITKICEFLGIKTIVKWSTDYFPLADLNKFTAVERLFNLCKQEGATEYVSGPLAQDYFDKSLFEEHNINVSWFNYQNYAKYPQLHGEFTHNVSIIDMLMMLGNTTKLESS